MSDQLGPKEYPGSDASGGHRLLIPCVGIHDAEVADDGARAIYRRRPGGAPPKGGLAVPAQSECVPAVVTLIGSAIATFDVDRKASRQYLMRAAAILHASTTRQESGVGEPTSRGGLAQWRLNQILDYIERHLAEPITGEDLAGLVDVSIGQLFRAFKASVGIPPLQFVASRRLELACKLLRTTDDPLSQIALAAGFCDQSHLCRVFRRVIGVTPGIWRKQKGVAPVPC